MPPEPKEERAMRANAVDTSTIPGWGVDADPENDPTYPIRDRSTGRRFGRDGLGQAAAAGDGRRDPAVDRA
jgi:hypothetical protein